MRRVIMDEEDAKRILEIAEVEIHDSCGSRCPGAGPVCSPDLEPLREAIADAHEPITGDFMYVIWFDIQIDADFFEKLLKKRGIGPVFRYHYRHTNDWAVIWHLGEV